jgi:hypothetical protein
LTEVGAVSSVAATLADTVSRFAQRADGADAEALRGLAAELNVIGAQFVDTPDDLPALIEA